MPFTNIDLLKKHTRTDDFGDDDEYLFHLLQVAEETVLRKIGYTESEIREVYGDEMPINAIHAVLMLAGYWYGQREAVGNGNNCPVPYGVEMMIAGVYDTCCGYYGHKRYAKR